MSVNKNRPNTTSAFKIYVKQTPIGQLWPVVVMWYWGANKEEDNLGFEAWVQLVASLIQSFVQDGCILGVFKEFCWNNLYVYKD